MTILLMCPSKARFAPVSAVAVSISLQFLWILALALSSCCQPQPSRRGEAGASGSNHVEARDAGFPAASSFDPDQALRMTAWKVLVAPDVTYIVTEILNSSNTSIEVLAGDPELLVDNDPSGDADRVRALVERGGVRWWGNFSMCSRADHELQKGVPTLMFGTMSNTFLKMLGQCSADLALVEDLEKSSVYRMLIDRHPKHGWREIAPGKRVYVVTECEYPPPQTNLKERAAAGIPEDEVFHMTPSEINFWTIDMVIVVRWNGGRKYVYLQAPWQVEFPENGSAEASRQHRGPAPKVMKQVPANSAE